MPTTMWAQFTRPRVCVLLEHHQHMQEKKSICNKISRTNDQQISITSILECTKKLVHKSIIFVDETKNSLGD